MKIMEKFEKPFVQYYLIPFVIFAVAFLLRAAWIGIHMGQDEVYYVGYASDILHGKSFANVFPPFFEMVLVPVLWLSGESEIVVHIFMAFLGALSVLFVYLIGRKFFNMWVGIIGAMLLMFNTTHWFFSAFGMLDVPATLFATSAIYFLWSGYVERNKKMLLYSSSENMRILLYIHRKEDVLYSLNYSCEYLVRYLSALGRIFYKKKTEIWRQVADYKKRKERGFERVVLL